MAKQQPYRMTKLAEIRPYEKNPRIIPQAAVDAVARSIQAFGFRSPIVVDANGVILAGHTRYKAAQQLGLAEVPVVWQSDITDIQARGYRIADNKAAEISTWDRDALDTEVRELSALFTQGDSGTNSRGGCSTFRTADLQTRCARRLQIEFPDWVQTRVKCAGFGVCLNPRFNRKAIQMQMDEILNKNTHEK